MNAARLARALEHGGFTHEQALVLSESLAEEIERTVATREQVELIVTREIAKLRAEMQGAISGLEGRIGDLRTELQSEVAGLNSRIAGVDAKIADLRSELQSEVAGLNSRIAGVDAKIADLRTEIYKEAASTKVELIKWMVGLLLAQTALILGLGRLLWQSAG